MDNQPGTKPARTEIVAPAAMSSSAIYAAGILAVLVWGGTAIVTRYVTGIFDPYLIGMLRSVGAGLVLVPVAFVVRPIRPRGRGETLLLLASALSSFVFFPLLFTLALRYTTASHMGLVLATQSIFTGLIASLADKHSPGLRWMLGCLVAFAGVAALVSFRFGLDDGGTVKGDLIGLSSALVASCGYVAGSHLSRRIGTWSTTVWGNIVGAVIVLPALLYYGAGTAWGAVGWPIWAAVVYICLGSSIVAYSAWYWALAKGGITRISALLFGTPVVTVLLAVAILNERLTVPLVISGVVILLGIGLAQGSSGAKK